MKQNLQTPATPLEMLSLFLPAGLLDYFDLVNHVSQETCFIFFLEEKPSIPQEHSHLHLHSKGFFGSVVILGGLSFVNSLHAYTFAGSADFPGWQAFF